MINALDVRVDHTATRPVATVKTAMCVTVIVAYKDFYV